MTTVLAVPTPPRVLTHQRPAHLRLLSQPLSRREAQEMFARHEMADTFARTCA